MMSIPKGGNETCAFCAKTVPHSEIVEWEVNSRYHGRQDPKNGYYICHECKLGEIARYQDKVARTFMKLKARSELPCCGGSNPED